MTKEQLDWLYTTGFNDIGANDDVVFVKDFVDNRTMIIYLSRLKPVYFVEMTFNLEDFPLFTLPNDVDFNILNPFIDLLIQYP